MNDIVDKTYLYDQTVRILGNSCLSSCCDFFFEHRYSDLESTLVNIYTKMPIKLNKNMIQVPVIQTMLKTVHSSCCKGPFLTESTAAN